MLTMHNLTVNKISWLCKQVRNNSSAIYSMILLYVVFYTHLVLQLHLCSNLWLLFLSFECTIMHNIPEKSVTPTDWHRLEIWVKLRKIVVYWSNLAKDEADCFRYTLLEKRSQLHYTHYALLIFYVFTSKTSHIWSVLHETFNLINWVAHTPQNLMDIGLTKTSASILYIYY